MKRLNLKKFRISLDLKSKQMADIMKLSKQHYSNIENGKKDPTYEFMEEFEKTFNVDVRDVWWLFKKSE